MWPTSDNCGRKSLFRLATAIFLLATLALPLSTVTLAQTDSGKKSTWQTIEFGIVKFNDQAPTSWNIYHGTK